MYSCTFITITLLHAQVTSNAQKSWLFQKLAQTVWYVCIMYIVGILDRIHVLTISVCYNVA